MRWAWDAAWAISVVSVMLAMVAMVGCTGTLPVPNAPLPEAGSSSREVADDTRGLHAEIVPARLSFDHALQIRTSTTGVPHELHDGDTVMTGDRIRASVQTSEDAYLYLAFCAHQELAVYPSQGGIRTRAGQRMVVPLRGELVFDGGPGLEVLYMILSRTELSVADPKLARALGATRPSNTPADCETTLDAKLAKPASNAGAAEPPVSGSKSVLRGAVVPRKSLPSRSSVANRRPAPPHAPSRHPTSAPPDPGFERDPDFERNPGAIVWYRVDDATGPADVVAADDDGIAVVRHAFIHVAQPSPR